MDIDLDDWEPINVMAAGMALREAAAYVAIASNILKLTSLRSHVQLLTDCATFLADAAHAYDPTDQRIRRQEPNP